MQHINGSLKDSNMASYIPGKYVIVEKVVVVTGLLKAASILAQNLKYNLEKNHFLLN